MIHIPNIEKAYLPRFKCGADPVTAAISGGAGLLGSVIGATTSADQADATNATNLRIAREQMALQQQR